VHFPGGGGYVLTFPVAAGDECLLVFGERAIGGWFQNGGVQEPDDHRFHDLSDAFALVGFRSSPRALGGVATNATELRNEGGSVVVRVDAGGVTLGAVSGAEPAVLGTALMTYLATLATAAGGPAPVPATLLATLVKVK
jgi:hypothetical protein